MTSTRAAADTRLEELQALQQRLLEAAPSWARGAELGPEVAAARRAALELAHERYVDLVPAYRRLAESAGLAGPADLGLVVDNLLFSGLFKSYDPERLQAGDFAAMNRWLDDVSTGVPSMDVSDVGGLRDWRARLRAHGTFLSFSSGSSGRLSFVPRDRPTFRALVANGATYADPNLPLSGFDCLVVGPRGEGIGFLDAGNGLARAAVRSHFLFDRPLTADAVRDLGGAAVAGGWLAPGEVEEADAHASQFIRAAALDGHPLLMFGAPFQVRRLCERIVASLGRLPTAPGSLVVTGGGWKTFSGERLTRAELLRLLGDALAIPAAQYVDSYSMCELNAALASCREGRYHVPPLLEPVVLDEAATGVVGQPGEGLLAFLDPFALSYPGFVITGDRATLGFGRCGCGRSGAFLEGEIERTAGAEVRGCGGVLGSILA